MARRYIVWRQCLNELSMHYGTSFDTEAKAVARAREMATDPHDHGLTYVEVTDGGDDGHVIFAARWNPSGGVA